MLAAFVYLRLALMQGIATVAVVDCDDKGNQQLCGEYGVQGFPTLKVQPPKQSARTLSCNMQPSLPSCILITMSGPLQKILDWPFAAFH